MSVICLLYSKSTPNTISSVFVSPLCQDLLALKEADVDDRGIVVDKLEEEHFEDELVLELSLGPMHFWKQVMQCI